MGRVDRGPARCGAHLGSVLLPSAGGLSAVVKLAEPGGEECQYLLTVAMFAFMVDECAQLGGVQGADAVLDAADRQLVVVGQRQPTVTHGRTATRACRTQTRVWEASGRVFGVMTTDADDGLGEPVAYAAPQDTGLPDAVERDPAALNSAEDLDEDRLRLDPLEAGMDPPERWSAADKY